MALATYEAAGRTFTVEAACTVDGEHLQIYRDGCLVAHAVSLANAREQIEGEIQIEFGIALAARIARNFTGESK